MAKQRTPDEIRAELAEARHAMTVGIEGLVSDVHPDALKHKAKDKAKETVDDAKKMASQAVVEVRNFFVDEYGVRWNNVGTVVLVAAGVVAVVGTLNGLGMLARRMARK